MNQLPSETAFKSGDSISKLCIGYQSTHKSHDATRHKDCVPSQIYAHPSVNTADSHCSATQKKTIVNNSDEKAEDAVQSTPYVIKRIRTPSGKGASPCQIEDDDSPNSVDTSDASKFKIGYADKPLTFDGFITESKLQKTSRWRAKKRLLDDGTRTVVSTPQADNANTLAAETPQIGHFCISTLKTSQLGNANKPEVNTPEPDNLNPSRTNIPQLGCADRPDADNARPLAANELVSGDCWDQIRISQL